MGRPTRLRVLIVDDHAAYGETLKNVLESAGCMVDVALTPYAGITLGASTHYDLGVVDLRMPQMDGLQVLESLRRRGHRCLLLATGYWEDVTPAEVLGAGGDGILRKPLDLGRLLQILDFLEADDTPGKVSLPPSLVDYGALRSPRLAA
jgi:DNA-binding response OmpR family regulator